MFLKFLLIENTHQINVILDKFRPILDFFYNWIFTHEKFWRGIFIKQCGIQIIKDVSTSNTFTEKQIESKCCVLFIFKWNTIIQINAGKKFMKINWFIIRKLEQHKIISMKRNFPTLSWILTNNLIITLKYCHISNQNYGRLNFCVVTLFSESY